jgi:hypothetical protein
MNDMTGAGSVSLGGFGSGVGQFSGPGCLFVDSSGGIYVGDALNHRIVRVANIETGAAGWQTLGGPAPGNGASAFNSPCIKD